MKDEKKKPDTKAEEAKEAKEGAEEKPKKSHKGLIIAIIVLVIAAVAAFFIFGSSGEDEEPSTTAESKTIVENEDDFFDGIEEDGAATDADVTEEDTDAEDEEDAEESVEAEDAEGTTEADGEDTKDDKKDDKETKKDAKETTTKKASNGLTSSDAAKVVAYYNAAVKKTNDAGKTKGQAAMSLDGSITADGGLGSVLDNKLVKKAISGALESGSGETSSIPGKGELKASDVTKAGAKSENGVTTIIIYLNEQTDGPSCEATDGPVGRGIGTLGNIDTALDALGAEITEGKENVKLTYKEGKIVCTIDEKTGKITSGTWHYLVDVNISSASIKLVIPFDVTNMKGKINYTVTV